MAKVVTAAARVEVVFVVAICFCIRPGAAQFHPHFMSVFLSTKWTWKWGSSNSPLLLLYSSATATKGKPKATNESWHWCLCCYSRQCCISVLFLSDNEDLDGGRALMVVMGWLHPIFHLSSANDIWTCVSEYYSNGKYLLFCCKCSLSSVVVND